MNKECCFLHFLAAAAITGGSPSKWVYNGSDNICGNPPSAY